MLWSRGKSSRLGHPDTDTVRLVPEPAAGQDGSDPVFVDSSGRRGRRIRRVVYAAGALCAGYTAVLALSFMGATPFAPRTVLPVPGVPSEKPGSVGETPRDLPVTPATSPSGGPSVSPSDIPGPSATPTDSGQPSSPATSPGPPTTPTGDTSPTTASGTPSDTETPASTGPPEETPSPSPATSGTTPTASPGTDDTASGDIPSGA
ncbi:hypothetical protein [Streptomyces sp. NBC_01451]|uniref:hypothetical protein n=1 Tax=Streptomyces sp. NBC_01451 TaxID=2903872 RepID=UPI002E317F86|nr:hypothetical protein [Streptomyces sp. NBC_01451]